MTAQTVVRREVTVNATVERAFAVFTERFDAVKPREHNLLGSPIVETVLEPHVGGRILDRAEDGTVCAWARIVICDPPTRLVFTWDIGPTWQLEDDTDHASEVEIRFSPAGDGRTLVELEHRHLERHGAGWESLRDGIADEQGWPLYLSRYSALLDESATAAPESAAQPAEPTTA